jgi:hypothetical protein
MKSNIVGSFPFVAASRTIDFSAVPSFEVKKLTAIINLDTRQLIYAVATAGLGYTSIAGDVITLQFNTTAMSDTARLQVIYDDPFATVSLGNETTSILSAINDSTSKGKYQETEPTLSDGEVGPLQLDLHGNLKTVQQGPVSVIPVAPIEVSNFPVVQPVIGDSVNNESVGQYATTNIIPSKTTLVSGLNNGTDIFPIRVDNDGSPLVKPGATFPVSGPLTNTELRAAVVPVSLAANQSTNLNQYGGVATTLGRKAASASMPVVAASDEILDQVITGASGLQAINNNLLLPAAGTTATDLQQYRSIALQINAAAATTAVTVNFEASNDNVNFVSVLLVDRANPNAAPVSSYGIVASTNRFFEGPVQFRFFRARISAAIVAGSVQSFTILRMAPYINPQVFVGQGSSLATVSTVSSVSAVNSASLSSVFSTLIASAAITTTTTSGGISSLNQQSAAFQFAVTAFSGTLPTLDVSIEESLDNGTNWKKIYDFERVTTTGTFRSPAILLHGVQYRIVRTVGGTTPSFTMSLAVNTRATVSLCARRIIDRTINPNTLNSTTPVLDVRGCSRFQIVQSSAVGATVAPVFTLQGSDDGANWYDFATTVMGAASTNTVAKTIDDSPSFVRARVSTAGVSSVINYISISAQ